MSNILVSGVLVNPFNRPLPNAIITLTAISNSFTVLTGANVTSRTNEAGEYEFHLQPGNYAVYVAKDSYRDFYGAISVTATTPPTTLNVLLKQNAMEAELPPDLVEFFQQVQNQVVVVGNGADEAARIATEKAGAAAVSESNADTYKTEAKNAASTSSESAAISQEIANQLGDINKIIKDAGFEPVDSFEQGFTLTSIGQALRFESTGVFYSWRGAYPKNVPVGSTPEMTGGISRTAWVDVNDLTLRGQIKAPDGGEIVGFPRANVGSVLHSQGYFFHDEGEDVTAILQEWINTHKKTTIPKFTYPTIIKSNVIIPDGHELVIDNNAEQQTDEVDTWATAHVGSKYPMFRIAKGARDVIIRGKGWLNCIYEGVFAEGGNADEEKIYRPKINVKVIGKLIDASGRRYSKFGGITLYQAVEPDLSSSKVYQCGIRSTWDAVNLKRIGGGANGIGFYNCENPKLHSAETYGCGGNGVFTHNTTDPDFQSCRNIFNGLSGIQHGPHPNSSRGVISNNTNRLNTADGIDVRWTGAGTLSVKLDIHGNFHYKNGFFDGDLTRPTQDGSGIVTLAYVTDIYLNGNTSIDSAGSWLYLEGCGNVSGGINSGTVYTNKEGLFLGGGVVSNINLLGNDVRTPGVALSFGGSSAFSDINLEGRFVSSSSYGAITADSSSYTNVSINGRITSNATMWLTGGDWSGSTFYMGNSDLNFTTRSVRLNNLKFRADSGSLIGTNNRAGLNLDGLDSQTTSGTALLLKGCYGISLGASRLVTQSGKSLRLEPYNNTPCQEIYLDRAVLNGNAGTAYDSVYSKDITHQNTIINGTQSVLGEAPKVRDTYAIENTLTWNPGAIPANGSVIIDAPLLGAMPSDFSMASLSSSYTPAILLTRPIPDNTVRVTLYNPTSNPVTVSSGTLKVSVWRRK